MTSPPIDLIARDSHRGRLRESSPYALVADADPQRIEQCLASIRPFKIEAIVARHGQEAVSVLESRGAPKLLIVDLSLSHGNGLGDGFAVIDAIPPADRGRVPMIVWSSRREVREFAAHRLAGLRVRFLRHGVAPSVLVSTIEAIFSTRGTEKASVDRASAERGEEVHEAMAKLSDKAQRLCGTAGVAVYLRGPGEAPFRTSVTWLSDEPIPRSPDFLPSVFDAVLATRKSFFRTDVAMLPFSGFPTGIVRGLGAVPLIDVHGQIVGAMCVFDLHPITFGSAIIAALKALGRGVSVRAAAEPAVVETAVLAPLQEPAETAVTSRPPVIPATLLDRVAGNAAVAREMARVRREQGYLSVVLFDVNAAKGADQGTDSPTDPVGSVSETLIQTIRGSDLAIRWRADALLVVLPGLGLAEAKPVAERIRAALAASARHRLAVAGGVAEFRPDESFDSVVARADDRVRMAQMHGHNRVA